MSSTRALVTGESNAQAQVDDILRHPPCDCGPKNWKMIPVAISTLELVNLCIV